MNADHRRRKILLIGWDAADWKVAMPLIDAGKMPNLAKLIEEGICGNIATLQPVLSPILWTVWVKLPPPKRLAISAKPIGNRNATLGAGVQPAESTP